MSTTRPPLRGQRVVRATGPRTQQHSRRNGIRIGLYSPKHQSGPM